MKVKSRRFILLLLAATMAAMPTYAGMSSQEGIKRVQVGDIAMAYEVQGQGNPLVLIMGYSGTMDLWDPRFLDLLSSKYRIIIFDNRGMGDTSAPSGNFSIAQFANDTIGLMEALGIEKANVLSWSMGTYVAQEMAIRHPEKVDKMILIAGDCGGNEAVMPSPEVLDALTNTTGSPEERGKRLFEVLFPSEWLSRQPASYEWFPIPKETSSSENIERQSQAIADWTGTYDRLDRILSQTLVVTGTEDVIAPPENAFILASKINGSWLVQFEEGGHGLMYQYPERLAGVVEDFIELS